MNKVGKRPKYKERDTVEIVNDGKTFSIFKDMAIKLGASKKWNVGKRGKNHRNGQVGRIIKGDWHPSQSRRYVYLLDLGDEEILIGENGIKKINELLYILKSSINIKAT